MKSIRRSVLAALGAAVILALPAAASAGDYGYKYGHDRGYGHKGWKHGGWNHHKAHRAPGALGGHPGYKKPYRLDRYQVVNRLLNAGYFNIYRLHRDGRYWKAKVRGFYGHRSVVYVDAYNGRIIRHR